MTLKLVLDQYVQNQFNFGRPINFCIYDEDEQPFDASTYTSTVSKTLWILEHYLLEDGAT